MGNYVYCATSLDGYIARTDGSIDWLAPYENLPEEDYGYYDFISNMDAIIMGRNTFEKIQSFELWPYEIPVFVLSITLQQNEPSEQYKIVNEPIYNLTKDLQNIGYKNLYIDGGKTIQSFLEQDLIDELIITTVPVILGDGIPLFSKMDIEKKLLLKETKIFDNGLVQNEYIFQK